MKRLAPEQLVLAAFVGAGVGAAAGALAAWAGALPGLLFAIAMLIATLAGVAPPKGAPGYFVRGLLTFVLFWLHINLIVAFIIYLSDGEFHFGFYLFGRRQGQALMLVGPQRMSALLGGALSGLIGFAACARLWVGARYRRALTPRATVADLIAALDDADPDIRARAVRALGRLGPAAAAAGRLRALAGQDREPVAGLAFLALLRIAPDLSAAAAWLRHDLRKDVSAVTAVTCWQGADLLGPEAVGLLADVVQAYTEPASVRLRAVEILGAGGYTAAGAEPALDRARQYDPDTGVRSAAARALRRVRLDPAALRRRRLVRWAVALLLVGAVFLGISWTPFGRGLSIWFWSYTNWSAAVPAVERGLADGSPYVRLAAVEAAYRHGPAARPVAAALVQLVRKETDGNAGGRAIFALELIGPEITPLLIPLLTADRAEARRAAAYLLGRYGTAAREALPALIAATRDRDEWVRVAAVTAVTWVARDQAGQLTPAGRDALTTALTDPSEAVRRAARDAPGIQARRP